MKQDERAERFELRCESCGRAVAPRPYRPRCPACDGTLTFRYRTSTAETARLARPVRRMWEYAPLLPVEQPEAAATLDEGGTPLVPAVGEWGCRLWLKDESRNPTGSHKDRALSVAVTRGRELGFTSCAVISAGSTGLSTAAYATRAGLRCAIVVPAGTPDERLLPLALYGATVFEAAGTFDYALRLVEQLAQDRPVYVTSTYRRGNPYQAEGARTIGFEIAAQLAELLAGGQAAQAARAAAGSSEMPPEAGPAGAAALPAGAAPDWIVVPTGGGGTAAGIWRAYRELRELGVLAPDARLPRIATVQPAAYNALQIALERDLHTEAELYALGISEETPTVQAKLQHGVPPDAVYALAAVRESGGTAVAVSDEAALAAQRRLGAEGLFAEPSAAAAAAGVQRLVEQGTIGAADRVVAIVTGSGFRELAAVGNTTRVERTPLTAGALGTFLDGGR